MAKKKVLVASRGLTPRQKGRIARLGEKKGACGISGPHTREKTRRIVMLLTDPKKRSMAAKF